MTSSSYFALTLRDFATGFHLRARFIVTLCVACTLVMSSCRREAATRAGQTADRVQTALALLPFDAQMVVAVDLDRLRAQPGWSLVFSVLARNATSLWGDLATAAGIDPLHNLHALVVGLPAYRQTDDRFMLVADVDRIDEGRLRQAVATRLGAGTSVEIRGHQVVLRHGTWTRAPSSALLDNWEAQRLCQRAAAGHALWFAATVPMEVRRAMMQDSRFPDVASMARVYGNVDLQNGMMADIAAELMSSADASELLHRLTIFLNQSKRHPDLLVHGVAPILETVRLSLDDATVHARLELPMASFSECVERFESLAHLLGTK